MGLKGENSCLRKLSYGFQRCRAVIRANIKKRLYRGIPFLIEVAEYPETDYAQTRREVLRHIRLQQATAGAA